MASRLSPSTGPLFPREFLRCWPWSSYVFASQGAVTSGGVDNGSPGLGTLNYSSPSPMAGVTPAPRLTLNPVHTPVLLPRGSSGQIPSSSTVRLSPPCSTLPSAATLDTQLSNFPPLPPPAACRDVPRSTSTPIRHHPQPRRSCPSPTMPDSPVPSISSRAAPRESTRSHNVPTSAEDSVAQCVSLPVHSVDEYHRLGLAACDDRPGSVSHLLVRF